MTHEIKKEVSNILCLGQTVSEDIQNISSLSEEQLIESIFDGDVSISSRCACLDLLTTRDLDKGMEVVNNVLSMYNFASTHDLEKLLFNAVKTNIHFSLRAEIARSLYEEKKELSYEAFYYLINHATSEVSSTIHVDLYKYLFYLGKLLTDEKEVTPKYFKEICEL